MANWFIKNAVITGSAKVPGFERNIQPIALGEFTVTNNPKPSRADDRKQGTVPRFSSNFYHAPAMSGDLATSLAAMGKGQNVKEVVITSVQSTGKNHVVQIQYTLGSQGSTYVRTWALFFDPEQEPKGSGLWYTAEFLTDGLKIETNQVGQNQQAKGKSAASLSHLNRQAGG
jgi:hypothetical protein